MLYTGLDFHRSFSYITTTNDRGEVIGQKKLPSNGEVVDFLKGFKDTMEVAIEATPSWYWLYDCLEDEGFNAKLSHPLRTKAIAYAKVKTDKVDSATLAHLLTSDLFGKAGMAFLHSLSLPENYRIALAGYLTVY